MRTSGTMIRSDGVGVYIILDDYSGKRARVKSTIPLKKGDRVSIVGNNVVGLAGAQTPITVIRV